MFQSLSRLNAIALAKHPALVDKTQPVEIGGRCLGLGRGRKSGMEACRMEARKPVFGKSNSVEDMQHVRLMALLQELEREHGRKGAAADGGAGAAGRARDDAAPGDVPAAGLRPGRADRLAQARALRHAESAGKVGATPARAHLVALAEVAGSRRGGSRRQLL